VESFDVVIVGAGPTGLACGIELKRRGVRAVLIDKGCVVNSIYNYPTNMVFFTTPELLEIGDVPMTSLNEKPVRGEALKYTAASPITTNSTFASMNAWRESPAMTERF
jgi:thioredoxin reductase (NADPH)